MYEPFTCPSIPANRTSTRRSCYSSNATASCRNSPMSGSTPCARFESPACVIPKRDGTWCCCRPLTVRWLKQAARISTISWAEEACPGACHHVHFLLAVTAPWHKHQNCVLLLRQATIHAYRKLCPTTLADLFRYPGHPIPLARHHQDVASYPNIIILAAARCGDVIGVQHANISSLSV